MLEELLCRQIARLPPIVDRLGDIRREIAEADEPREIRIVGGSGRVAFFLGR